jgi:hypothetical protein
MAPRAGKAVPLRGLTESRAASLAARVDPLDARAQQSAADGSGKASDQ